MKPKTKFELNQDIIAELEIEMANIFNQFQKYKPFPVAEILSTLTFVLTSMAITSNLSEKELLSFVKKIYNSTSSKDISELN